MGDYLEKISQCDINSHTRIGALSECADLLANGYQYMFSSIQRESWFFKFHHKANGRYIVVVVKDNWYELREKDVVLKRVEY